MKTIYRAFLIAVALTTAGQGLAFSQEKPQPAPAAPQGTGPIAHGASSTPQAAGPAAPGSQTPQGTVVPAGPRAIPELPPADPKNFTAALPKPETVDAFLRQLWGYDENRTWRVAGVQGTAAPGVSRVTVWILEKAPGAEIQQMVFLVTPDGEHAIEGYNVISFGAHPFASTRAMMRAGAQGPYHGPAGTEFEFVEFVDLQCPHCKAAQGVMDQLEKDFPKAHVAIEMFPLVNIHPSAYKAAKYAVCAQRVSNAAFFKYIHEVFETQEGFAPMTEDALLKAAATRAGLDGTAVATCANSQAARDSVDAQMRLALSAGVDETPLLVVNGRMLPDFNGIPYDQLKKIILYQAALDKVDAGATPQASRTATPQVNPQNLP